MSMLCVVLPFLFTQPSFESNPSPTHDGPEPGQDVSVGVAGEFRLAPVPGMSIEVDLERPGAVRVSGHVGFQMEGNASCNRRKYHLRWMTGVDVTVDGDRVPGTYVTENWARDEHYHDMPFVASIELDPGTYLIEVRAEAIMQNRSNNTCEVYFKEGQYHGMTVEVLQPCGSGD
jgi:hypothetical protein